MVNAGATKISELFEDSTNITFFFENVEKAGKPKENKNPRKSKTIIKGLMLLKMFERILFSLTFFIMCYSNGNTPFNG